MLRSEIIARRRAFKIQGYQTLANVGLDGDYVSPPQLTSCSPTGPVLLAYHWLDVPSAIRYKEQLSKLGYLLGMEFNNIVDAALAQAGSNRADIYITQAFHLLPPQRSSSVSPKHVDACFNEITRYELENRQVIALGTAAASACERAGVSPAHRVMHPSARCSETRKIGALADALRLILGRQATN